MSKNRWPCLTNISKLPCGLSGIFMGTGKSGWQMLTNKQFMLFGISHSHVDWLTLDLCLWRDRGLVGQHPQMGSFQQKDHGFRMLSRTVLSHSRCWPIRNVAPSGVGLLGITATGHNVWLWLSEKHDNPNYGHVCWFTLSTVLKQPANLGVVVWG